MCRSADWHVFYVFLKLKVAKHKVKPQETEEWSDEELLNG